MYSQHGDIRLGWVNNNVFFFLSKTSFKMPLLVECGACQEVTDNKKVDNTLQKLT